MLLSASPLRWNRKPGDLRRGRIPQQQARSQVAAFEDRHPVIGQIGRAGQFRFDENERHFFPGQLRNELRRGFAEHRDDQHGVRQVGQRVAASLPERFDSKLVVTYYLHSDIEIAALFISSQDAPVRDLPEVSSFEVGHQAGDPVMTPGGEQRSVRVRFVVDFPHHFLYFPETFGRHFAAVVDHPVYGAFRNSRELGDVFYRNFFIRFAHALSCFVCSPWFAAGRRMSVPVAKLPVKIANIFQSAEFYFVHVHETPEN